MRAASSSPTGARRMDTSFHSETWTPPVPNAMAGPKTGSRVAPRNISTPRGAIGCTRIDPGSSSVPGAPQRAAGGRRFRHEWPWGSGGKGARPRSRFCGSPRARRPSTPPASRTSPRPGWPLRHPGRSPREGNEGQRREGGRRFPGRRASAPLRGSSGGSAPGRGQSRSGPCPSVWLSAAATEWSTPARSAVAADSGSA